MRMSNTNRLRLEALEARDVPAGDLASALQFTGLPVGSNIRVASDLVGNTIVAGTYTGTIDLDPTTAGVTDVTSQGGTDIFVAKYGQDGKLVWARSIGGTANDTLSALRFDGAGNVYLAGTFNGAVDFNPDPNVTATATAAAGGSGFVMKLNFYGNLTWADTLDGTSAVSNIASDPQGGVVATGTFQATTDFDPADSGAGDLTATNANGAAFAWRLDPNGNFTWARALTTTGTIAAPAVTLDGNGFVYVGGQFTGTADLNPADGVKATFAAGTTSMPYVVKLTSMGSYAWAKTARTITPAANAPNNVVGLGVDSIGNVYAAGTFAGTLDFDPSANTASLTSAGGADGFVWKLDPSGNMRWARQVGGVNSETLTDLFVDKAGNSYTTGTFTGLADFDPNPLNTINLIAGSGDSDGYILKLTPQGMLAYARDIGGGDSTMAPTGIWANGAGAITVAGTFSGVADLDPSTVVVQANGGTGSAFVAKLTPSATATPGPANRPPKNISAGGPYVINEGQGLSLTATATDPDKDPLTFTWDLNGDGKFGDAVGSSVTLTPAQMAALGLQDGTSMPRTITLRVKDGVNLPVDVVAQLTIKDVPPTVKVNAPATVAQGKLPTITTVVKSDPSTADMAAGFRYSYDFNDDGTWDLGDGATYAGSSANAAVQVPAQFLPNSGPLAVRVRTFDKDGAYTDKVVTIEIENTPPTATFSVSGTPAVGNPVTFTFTNQQDTPNDMAAGFKYAFDFNGDGQWDVTGTNPSAQHTFQSVGTFTVKAAIIDQDGAFTTYTTTVVVDQF
jgi:hypothetical protein